MRVYDNPNHRQYGPIRRMWVVLAQLGLLNAAEVWSTDYEKPWDEHLAQVLAVHNQPESMAQRNFIHALMIGGYDNVS